MKKYEIYIIELLLFISIIMFNIVYNNYFLQSLSIILIGIYMLFRYKMMKDNNYLKSIVTKITISCLLVYFVTTYLIGLILGFNRTILVLSVNYFVKVILLEVVVIVFEEIIRYIICRNKQHKKLALVIYTLLLSILSIIMEIKGFDLKDNEIFFIFVTTIVIPIISRQCICSYLTYKVSYKPALIFNLVMSLYAYLLPIVPSLGNYLYAVGNVALPYAIYFMVSKLTKYKEKEIVRNKISLRRLSYIPVMVVLIILVILVSGAFSHTLIAIGSNSMSPCYERGDAIIYKKIDSKNLKIGDVIAFKNRGRVVTHRIINIKKIDDKSLYITKGDANKSVDTWEVKDSDVLGIVKYSIKYIGYPTLWFNDLYTGKETNS